MFFVTVNGKRISKTNFARKNEAETEFKSMLSHYGEEALTKWAFN